MTEDPLPNWRLIRSFRYAIRGIFHALYAERHMGIHMLAAFIAISAGIYFRIDRTEWLCLLLSITLVLVTESVNTAIELSVDLTTRKRKLRAMLSKDVAAGAVLIAALNSVITGYIIFFDRLIALFKGGS